MILISFTTETGGLKTQRIQRIKTGFGYKNLFPLREALNFDDRLLKEELIL